MQRTELIDAATWLGRFVGPGPAGLGHPRQALHHRARPAAGRRLPARPLDEVADATTFVSIDRPDAVAHAVRDVLVQAPR